MSLELHVSGGALDGTRATFDRERVLVGRDPHADLRFDAQRDREVSARHAELRRVDGRYLLRDLNSTNGTFLNGVRIVAEREVHDGDRIGCGAGGPVLTVRLTRAAATADPGAAAASGARAAAPRAPRRAARSGLAVAFLAAVALVTAGGWMALRLRDGVRPPDGTDPSVATGDAPGAPEPPRAPAAPTGAPPGASPTAAVRASGDMDYTGVTATNGPAIVLVAVEMPSGERSTGTAFSVSRDGLLVTNRHVVRDPDGALPRRIAVQFADTDEWLPARVVRVADEADLAALQVEVEGPFPVVRGVAAPGTEPEVGSPVALIGYPLGLDTPMDRSETGTIASASLFRGMVSKRVRGTLQIDAYAGHGSSGSPVFDRRGAVVGVVFGGPREGSGRIVYAVSGEELLAFLSGSAVARVP